MSETMRTIYEKIATHKKHAENALRLSVHHSKLDIKWMDKYHYHQKLIDKLSKYTNTEVR